MKTATKFVVALTVLWTGAALAQTAPPPQPAAAQQSLASTLNVYVFPTAGQDAQQQSIDEGTCYNWAVQNTGSDPFALQKQAQQQQQQTQQAQQQAQHVGAGAGAQGAVGGAAAGALIGAIAGDAAGLLAGRSAGRHARASATQQATQQGQQAQAATAQQIDNFKKAFSVCLEGNNYMVKY
jgi:hypothetical protein